MFGTKRYAIRGDHHGSRFGNHYLTGITQVSEYVIVCGSIKGKLDSVADDNINDNDPFFITINESEDYWRQLTESAHPGTLAVDNNGNILMPAIKSDGLLLYNYTPSGDMLPTRQISIPGRGLSHPKITVNLNRNGYLITAYWLDNKGNGGITILNWAENQTTPTTVFIPNYIAPSNPPKTPRSTFPTAVLSTASGVIISARFHLKYDEIHGHTNTVIIRDNHDYYFKPLKHFIRPYVTFESAGVVEDISGHLYILHSIHYYYQNINTKAKTSKITPDGEEIELGWPKVIEEKGFNMTPIGICANSETIFVYGLREERTWTYDKQWGARKTSTPFVYSYEFNGKESHLKNVKFYEPNEFWIDIILYVDDDYLYISGITQAAQEKPKEILVRKYTKNGSQL